MLRTSYVIVLALAVTPIPSILAVPAPCAASSWGWPGFVMGNNPWGAVLSPSESSALSSVLSNACASYNVPSSTSSSSTAPATSLSAVYVAGSTTTEVFSSTTSISTPATTSTIAQTSMTSSSPITTLSTTSSSTSSSPIVITSSSTETSSTSSSTPVTTSTSTRPTTTSSSPASTSSSSSSAAPAPSSSNSFSSSGSNGSGASDADVSTYLSTHNTVRAQHGASALVWNNTLAAAAQKWSNGCVFKHSGGTLGPFGENLAAGTGSSYDITSAVTSWTNEASQYNAGSPVASHFTQVVWKASTQLGCAVTSCASGTIFPASNGNANYYVCEYYPQGNVIGAFGTNVQA